MNLFYLLNVTLWALTIIPWISIGQIIIPESFYLQFPKLAPKCDITIVESMPKNLTYTSDVFVAPSTAWAWKKIISQYRQSLRITSFYWSLLNNDVSKSHFPSSKVGEDIFNMLMNKTLTHSLEIVVNQSSKNNDLKLLKQGKRKVTVYNVDMTKLKGGRGVQHAKLWIADNRTVYIGSANMDWRALTQVKELGLFLPDCAPLAEDFDRFWSILKLASQRSSNLKKSDIPSYLNPKYNLHNPLIATVHGSLYKLYTATSPQYLNPANRTFDLDAIINTIKTADKFICISVMDLYPLIIGYGSFKDEYWGYIREYLVKAAIERKVVVKLLISKWTHTNKDMLVYLKSLLQLNKIYHVNIQVKIFVVPAFNQNQRIIPYSRVSHSKYMITDKTAYVGTSNWSGDYFYFTGGASLVATELKAQSGKYTLIKQLKRVFDSDWYSVYAHDL